MKSFFKRTSISLAILGMASSVHAAKLYDNSSWFPQLSGAFIGFEGLDLKPQNDDLDYFTTRPDTPSSNFNSKTVFTTYNWNWRVYGGIQFTENDELTLSWMQQRTSNANAISNTGSILTIPRWFTLNFWENITGTTTFALDDVYAVWGHTINFNNPWSVRFAAGIDYARLNNKLKVVENIFTSGIANIGFASKNRMNGIGPRIELDATYHLQYGFALFANSNVALLASKRSVSFYSINENPNVILINTQYPDRNVVVPKLGLKLGVSYSHVFGQAGAEGPLCRLTTLTVDVGWQAETYIHAIERPDESNILATLGVGTPVLASTKVSNFGDQGVFVGIKLSSDWL